MSSVILTIVCRSDFIVKLISMHAPIARFIQDSLVQYWKDNGVLLSNLNVTNILNDF